MPVDISFLSFVLPQSGIFAIMKVGFVHAKWVVLTRRLVVLNSVDL